MQAASAAAAGLPSSSATALQTALQELQNGTLIKRSVVNGAAANTNIPIAGLLLGDILVSVWELVSGVPTTDRTSTTTITSDGNIQCSAITTGNKVDVFWMKRT